MIPEDPQKTMSLLSNVSDPEGGCTRRPPKMGHEVLRLLRLGLKGPEDGAVSCPAERVKCIKQYERFEVILPVKNTFWMF